MIRCRLEQRLLAVCIICFTCFICIICFTVLVCASNGERRVSNEQRLCDNAAADYCLSDRSVKPLPLGMGIEGPFLLGHDGLGTG
jgi:hypothetical protein